MDLDGRVLGKLRYLPLTPALQFGIVNYNIDDEESNDLLIQKRAGGGGSLVNEDCETHFEDAFPNGVGEAGVSPLGERGLLNGQFEWYRGISFRLII